MTFQGRPLPKVSLILQEPYAILTPFYLHFHKILPNVEGKEKDYPIYRDPDWLLKGVLLTHDFTVVIRQTDITRRKSPSHNKQMVTG